jgi:hypothetical protein
VQPSQEAIDAAVHDVQNAILDALREHCPQSKPTRYSWNAWSDACSSLIRAHRAARRRYTTSYDSLRLSQDPAGEAQYKALRNQLKKQLRRESRNT